MDEEKRRRHSALEAGREMLESYKSKRLNRKSNNKTLEQASDDESFQAEPENHSINHRNISINENTLSRDITNSSVSMSEGEGDIDLDGLAGRITELNEIYQNKVAAAEALHAEIDTFRAETSSPTSSHSHNSSIQYKDVIGTYHSKFQEFERALNQRDNLIEDLTTSLQQALASRDALITQIDILTQLGISRNGNLNDNNFTDSNNDYDEKKDLVLQLSSQLHQSKQQIKKLENERENQKSELNNYKDQLENLNEKMRDNSKEESPDHSLVEELQKKYEEQIDKIKKDMQIIVNKFASETSANEIKHDKEIKELQLKHEAELQKLKEENKVLEIRHQNEMSALQAKYEDCVTKCITFESELKKQMKIYKKEKSLWNDQIQLHKLQLEEMTTKYLSATAVLDSKESIERSLEQAQSEAATLKTENDSLRFKLDDLTARYSAAQNLLENNQIQERTLNNKIFSLEKSLSRVSGISLNEFDETMYHTLDGIAIEFQMTKQKLEEKAILEEELVKKIQDLEDLVRQGQKELESANIAKEDYEKQLKDMKNNCKCLQAEVNSNIQRQPSLIINSGQDMQDLQRMISQSFELEIESLRKTLERRDKETAEYIKKLETLSSTNEKLVQESEQLKTGLATAYAQCAMIEDKLDQTIGFNDSKFSDSNLNQSLFNSTSDIEDQMYRQSSYNNVLMKLETCRNQLEEFEREKMLLLNDLDKRNRENDDLRAKIEEKEEQYRHEISMDLNLLRTELEEKHAKEMENLRTYFEQKCLEMEKQYSEEVFSQQSKKVSDESEVEELSLDCGGGGDASTNGNEKNLKNDSNTSISNGLKYTVEEKGSKLTTEPKEKMGYLKQSKSNSVLAINQFCQTEQTENPQSTEVQESHSELNELRADYQRQLQEQIELARIDITNALREKVEALIAADAESVEKWPAELLELRNKFTSNMKREIQQLKERHVSEIKRVKQESEQEINSLREEIRKITSVTHESLQNNLLKERDTLHKTFTTLKGLVGQLIDYFVVCEEEVNTTLLNEVLKKQPSFRPDPCLDSALNVHPKRVHFAPQSSEITSIVGSDSYLFDLINSDKDVVKSLKNELDTCLQRLKSDSAKLLNTSFSDSESWSTGIGDSPRNQLKEAEKAVITVKEENERLKSKMLDLQQRLHIAESKKEIISEGYGEQNETEASEDYSQLQDRAKYVVMNGCNDTGYLLQLIDELTTQADKSLEETRKEKDDLQKQVSLNLTTPTPNMHRVRSVKIEAADKQLRLTRKFQAEQADEREQERDEAAKQIQELQDKLREKEREKDRDHHNTTVESARSPTLSTLSGSLQHQSSDEFENEGSVEALTVQLRELEAKKAETDNELRQALSKIWDLREVIHDLEQQVQSKGEREDILMRQIEQLEEIIVSQTRNQQELSQELEAIRTGNENKQLSDHIGHLQEELRKHQLSSEQLTANSSALRQLRLELRDLQSQLERKTRELESLHVCGSSLSISQPSEDISIRDQLDAARCPTPDDPTSPPILPLDNVLKLKDTLLRHFRVQDVAFKRLRDLDIQLGGVQRQNEELLAEQEILQQTTSEQLFQIETLRARLEQQKQNAPFAQRQATSRLETQLHEINGRLQITERALLDKDMELSEVKTQLERVSRLLSEKENEIVNVVQSENDFIKKLKDKLEISEEDKRILVAKLAVQDKSQNVPQLIDTMLAEKNEEIERLKTRLADTEKQLDIYLSLDEAQLRELLRQNEHQKNSARTLSDILSINSDCEEESEEAIRERSNFMRSQNISHFKGPLPAVLQKKDVTDFSQEINETPVVPRLDLGGSQSQSYGSELIVDSNIIDASKAGESAQSQSEDVESDATNGSSTISEDPNYLCPRHGHLTHPAPVIQNNLPALDMTSQRIEECEAFELHQELVAKSALLQQREAELMEIQNNLKQLHENIKSLNQDRLFYKEEFEKMKDNELKIQRDYEEVENLLKIRDEELSNCKEQIQMHDKLMHEQAIQSEVALSEKLGEIINLKEELSEKDTAIHSLKQRLINLEAERLELLEYQRKIEMYQMELSEKQGEIRRLSEGLSNKDMMIRRLEELTRRSSINGGSTSSEKDQEIFHLQEYLKEKDKVIRQMSDDSKDLHRALETIQNKMKESGNVVELRQKLKRERNDNLKLTKDIVKLRTEIEMMNSSRRADIEDNDIAEKIQRELNLSLKLDQKLLEAVDSETEVTNISNNIKGDKTNKEYEELKRQNEELEIEKEMLKSQIAEYDNRILQLKNDTDEELKKVSKLEEELAKEKHKVRLLTLQLQREKQTTEEDKVRDTELIRELRIKLDEAIEFRDKLLMEQKNLELTNSMKIHNKDDAIVAEAEYKKQQMALSAKLECEQSQHSEIKENYKKLRLEKERIEKQLIEAQDKVEKLMMSLELADCQKDQLKADLRKAKEELKVKIKDFEWQKSILKTMNDAENKRKQCKIEEQIDIKQLKQDLKNAQDVMMDFEADMKTLKTQLAEASEREAHQNHCIEALTDRETELCEQIEIAKHEEKKLRSIIAEQHTEIKLYLRREHDLAEELKKEKSPLDMNSSPSKVLQRIKDLNARIEGLSQDKIHLHEKTIRLREERDRYLDQIRFLEAQLSQANRSVQPVVSRSDSNERLQNFYGMYMRAKSRQKALVYQKQYLYCIIAGYQRVEANTLAFLSQLTQQQKQYVHRGHRKGRTRFRCAVFMVISIFRIKWLILRWRTGRRVGANVMLGNVAYRQQEIQPPEVSSRRNQADYSPPVREKSVAKIRLQWAT
uniref:Pericentrin/AKAP-450 centrosomal targeting domain-containing protein n=1 Tax=Trichogramma kaykai TaxID=54128 RepID=A0ABD2XID6_9HYME